MLKVAVTGGIACGKSLVGSYLSSEGADVCDADDLAHRRLRPGETVYEKVVAAFGRQAVAPAGEINRARLAQVVFSNAEKLAALNAIVHPEVRKDWRDWLACAARGRAAAVIVPLLYEIGEGAGWDAVICVASPGRCQWQRLRERGLSDEQARARIAAQMPLTEKMKRADYVIFNCGTRELLRDQARRVWDSLMEK